MSTTRSKSFLAAEAIAAYVEAEEWQIRETRSALHEVDGGDAIAHEQVASWLQSWGNPASPKRPYEDRLVTPGDIAPGPDPRLHSRE